MAISLLLNFRLIVRRAFTMSQSMLRPCSCTQLTSRRSNFTGLTQQLSRLSVAPQPARPLKVAVEASGRKCHLTGQKANNGYNVTFSHKRNKRLQHVNLQERKVYWPEKQRWVKIKLSTKALKTVERDGLQKVANEHGVDLSKLPFKDVRPQRVDYLANRAEVCPPMPRRIAKRRMKNPEKLAASKKKPNVTKYIAGGRMIVTRAE